MVHSQEEINCGLQKIGTWGIWIKMEGLGFTDQIVLDPILTDMHFGRTLFGGLSTVSHTLPTLIFIIKMG